MNLATDAACDCHAHIFGDRNRYPLASGAAYLPDAATLDDYQAVLAALGLERCVLVQPSVYGSDNRCLLDALQALGPRARGVAVLAPDTPHEQLLEMHRLGVRGVRLNCLSTPEAHLDSLGQLEERIRPLGWHIQILLRPADRLAAFARLAQSTTPLVLDHFASFAPDANEAELMALFALAAERNIWIKLSAPYLFSQCTGADLRYYRQFTERALEAMADRLLLATDWPHPALQDRSLTTARLRQTLLDWIPQDLQRQISVVNPKNLYGF